MPLKVSNHQASFQDPREISLGHDLRQAFSAALRTIDSRQAMTARSILMKGMAINLLCWLEYQHTGALNFVLYAV